MSKWYNCTRYQLLVSVVRLAGLFGVFECSGFKVLSKELANKYTQVLDGY